ncbi:MAG: Fic family protein [Candidatus Taylorbacteria bacterium]|nr:Fic family protein [Candidatus Taylorbacteria bacterium]
MTQLNNRQQRILDFIASKGQAQNQEVVEFFASQNDILSRETMTRELTELVSLKYIAKTGKGRAVSYKLVDAHPLLRAFDHESYLAKDPEVRSADFIKFNREIIPKLLGLFSDDEVVMLKEKGDEFRKRIAELPKTLIQKEYERITIELSWKSSKIEGNTYSLIDTETLIKEHIEAVGHKREEAVMILNHKKALDYIFNNKDRFKNISLRDIEDIHRLLVDGLDVRFGLRSKAVGITGTNYRPLDNNYQIREAIEKTCVEINKADDPWSKALISLIMTAYIQPFEDGNKRTSRLMANACLITGEVCPLSFRSIDENDYKKAIIVFYELQNALPMKRIFLEQFKFATDN